MQMMPRTWVSQTHPEITLCLPQYYPGDTYLCALGAVESLRGYPVVEFRTLLNQRKTTLTEEERSEYYALVRIGRGWRTLLAGDRYRK